MRTTAFVFLLLFLGNMALAQTGKISGQTVNAKTGTPVSGVNITVSGSRTVSSDVNGNFTVSGLRPGTYTLTCSYVSFNTKVVEDVVVKAGDNTPVTISMEEKAAAGEVATVKVVKANKESVSSLLAIQKNMANVSDGVSAESIKKTPDRTTSDVIKRVSGAAIQDDRFAIVRGLNDRYNAAFINGAPLPSTESDRKAFAFDIFPSSILDNLIIYKTATPDMSGDFDGGIIDITTKSIPAKSFTQVSIGSAYNNLATFNNRQVSANKGSKDFFGIDDGTRAIPKGLPGPAELKNSTFAQRAAYAKLFASSQWGLGLGRNYQWGVITEKAAPNFNFQVSKGFNVERKQQEFLGALLSVSYNKNFTFTQGERNTYDFDMTAPPAGHIPQRGKYIDSTYNEETILAALANISVKLDSRNKISWKNNLSINTDNKLIRRTGPPDFEADSLLIAKDAVRWFTSNQIFSSQLTGEHVVSALKTRINWLGAYSKVEREIPNLSRTSYTGYLPDMIANFGLGTISQTSGNGTMFFTHSNEEIKSFKTDISQSYRFMKSDANFFKLGAGYQLRKRDFTSRLLGFSPYRNGVTFDNSLLLLPEDQIFTPEHLGKMSNGKGGFLLNDGTLPNSDYNASSAQTSAYIMNDQRFFKKFRLIYGVRMERFNQKLNTFKDINKEVNINTVITDFLPSVNLVYSITPKMNVRLSYSHTINRPEFRELAPYLFYDFVTQYTYEGFDTLQRAKIRNYDFRYEFFPGRAQLFSVSAFYKEFTNPIEIVSNPVFDNLAIYSNARSAKVYGVEAEFRTLVATLLGMSSNTLLDKFTISANAAYIKSNVKLGGFGLYDPALLVTDRPLQGQSPYVINSSLNYSDDRLGISSTISVNRVGDRILIAGTIFDADIYEQARTVVDIQLAKSFLKNRQLEVKLNLRDVLSQQQVFYFDYNQSKSYEADADRIFSSQVMPKGYSLNIAYKF